MLPNDTLNIDRQQASACWSAPRVRGAGAREESHMNRIICVVLDDPPPLVQCKTEPNKPFPELAQAPYSNSGAASFEMCSCGFEFGFDDDPGASNSASPTVAENLQRWREIVVFKTQAWPERLEALLAQLKRIGVSNV
jgi:hypothetical protein